MMTLLKPCLLKVSLKKKKLLTLITQIHKEEICIQYASLTETSHQPLGSNAWHNVRVFFGTGIVLWFQDAVRVL